MSQSPPKIQLHDVSPYLRNPLRTLDEVLRDRHIDRDQAMAGRLPEDPVNQDKTRRR